jgi:hypothetical protein
MASQVRKKCEISQLQRDTLGLHASDLLILGGPLTARRFLPSLNQGAKNPRGGLGAKARLKCRVRDARYDPSDVVVDLRFDAPVLSLGTGDVDR